MGVDVATGIPSAEQRLFFGKKELRDGEVLGEEFASEATVDVNLVRRSPHAARTLQDVLVATAFGVTDCLRKAGDEAQCDREIVLTAVSKNGDALQYASADLQADC